MRTMMSAAVIGVTALGGAVIAGGAQAQPYGSYSPPPGGYYDNGYYHSAPTYNGYYAPPRYDYYNAPSVAGALIGSVIAPAYDPEPVDRFGPDPNGAIAPDGHRIKCKLHTGYDSYGRYTRFRECF